MVSIFGVMKKRRLGKPLLTASPKLIGRRHLSICQGVVIPSMQEKGACIFPTSLFSEAMASGLVCRARRHVIVSANWLQAPVADMNWRVGAERDHKRKQRDGQLLEERPGRELRIR